jgi:ribosomal protein S18 acetylase RimI-like enzyme
MLHRLATLDDIPVLAKMNRELTEDEHHRNRFKSDAWFRQRMKVFLQGEYTAVIFELKNQIVAYALYRNHPDHDDSVYLRQIYVDRTMRRQGIGRQAMYILMNEYWPKDKRLTVEVLHSNHAAYEFYKSIGFRVYCLELEITQDDR